MLLTSRKFLTFYLNFYKLNPVLRYLNKHGNDGYYLAEWKKDINSFIKKANELNINFDLDQQ